MRLRRVLAHRAGTVWTLPAPTRSLWLFSTNAGEAHVAPACRAPAVDTTPAEEIPADQLEASSSPPVVLIRTAGEIIESGATRRHDVAERVFHRLLDSHKFLAINYTTIPADVGVACRESMRSRRSPERSWESTKTRRQDLNRDRRSSSSCGEWGAGGGMGIGHGVR